jgi:hypothetical protein
MSYIGLKLKNVLSRSSVFACGLIGMLIFFQNGYADTAATDLLSLETGFRQMYNLDFAAAHKTFETWQEQHPDDPLGAASNGAAYLFAEFERLHILDFNLFTEKRRLQEPEALPPDPQNKAAFEGELAKADNMAEKILSQSADDRDALFAKMLTDGLRGDYAALIQKQTCAALDFLKSSRSIAEKLIAIDPAYNDAYLALGIENYVLGLRSAPVRWMLRLSGAQTSKNKGIANLRITAEKGRYLGPYARLLLAIAALRDHDRSTARTLLADLAREFPQNHLYQSELVRLQN